MRPLILAIPLVLCFALSAFGQTYKWVDSSGKVHYSDKPPPSNVKTEKLREPARAAGMPVESDAEGEAKKSEVKKDPAKAGPSTPAQQEQAFRKRQADAAKDQEKQSQKDGQARDRAENCKRAKEALANLELGGRQTRIDANGERVFLSDQEIAQETAKVRRDVAAVCNY
jgi:hypothetical protein